LRTEMNATTEAIRSIAECIASVSSATDPVIVPATTFSRISALLDAIDSAAARDFDGTAPAFSGVAAMRAAPAPPVRGG
jgi:hypothetical protein